MSLATRCPRQPAAGRTLIAALGFSSGALVAMRIAFMDLDPTGMVMVGALLGALAAAAWRPEWAALATLALFSDVLYFGTHGISLPVGQLVPADVLFLGWWALTLLATLWLPERLFVRSGPILYAGAAYPLLLAMFFVYTHVSFGPGLQEMLRSGRPFLYLTLSIPLAYWLRRPGALDSALRAGLGLALGAALLQLIIYAAGVDVDPYGLFYEWQVWRGSFQGFDRSNQPLFGLSLLLIGGLVTLAIRARSRVKKLGWSLCCGLLLLSAAVSFGRGFWAAMAVGALTAVVLDGRARGGSPLAALASTAALGAIALALVAGAAGFTAGGFLDAVLDRGQGGAESLRYLDGTLGNRYDSINKALIGDHPFLGVGFFLGLGTALEAEFANTEHNLYADLMLRMGVLGLASFALLFWLYLRRCRLALSLGLSVPHRAAVVGCLGAGLGNLAWAVSSSHMIGKRGMFEMALMIAVVESVIALSGRRRAAAGEAA